MVVISIIEDDISDIISLVNLERNVVKEKIEWRSEYITPSDTTTITNYSAFLFDKTLRQTCHTARTGPLTGHAFSG